MSEQERKKKPVELNFHVGGKNKKNPEKSIFFLVGPDFITSEGSLTKEYTECRLPYQQHPKNQIVDAFLQGQR